MRAAHKLGLLQNLLSMFKTLTHEMIVGWGGGGGGGGGAVVELKGVFLKRHAATSKSKNHETDPV